MRVTRSYIRSRSGLLGLPEEVLAIILGHVCHLPSLMAVRLVCRLLRNVSYSVITSLNIDDDPFDTRRRTPGIAQQLEALPCLTKVCLYGRVLERGDLLALPRFSSLLRELHVRPVIYKSEAAQTFCEVVKGATGVTSLVWTRGGGGEELLPPLLASCPQLALLEVRSDQPFPAAFCDAVLRLSNLETLRISDQQRQVWGDLLPSLTALPRLRDVAAVPVTQSATTAGLAGLTRLTRLQLFLKGSAGVAALTALTRLSALQSLRVQTGWRWQHDVGAGQGELSFADLPTGLSQLTELALYGRFSFRGFGQLVGPLSRLARLQVQGSSPTRAIFLETPLQGLRYLNLSIDGGRRMELGSLCPAVKGLESFILTVNSLTETGYFEPLAQLTSLTSLRIRVAETGRRLVPVPVSVPASFLTGLTGLVELALFLVLSEHNAEADIQCIARLTRLQRLVLMSRDIQPLGLRSVARGREPPILERRHFEPLRALRWLEAWDLNRAWRTPRGRANDPDEVVKELCCCPGYCSRHYHLMSKRWRSRPMINDVAHPTYPFVG